MNLHKWIIHFGFSQIVVGFKMQYISLYTMLAFAIVRVDDEKIERKDFIYWHNNVFQKSYLLTLGLSDLSNYIYCII